MTTLLLPLQVRKRGAAQPAFAFAQADVIGPHGIVGERGLLAMLRAREQFEMNAAAIEQQRAENARLRTEADRLTNDPAALEELARGELGLMRPGEKVFIVKDLKPPAAH